MHIILTLPAGDTELYAELRNQLSGVATVAEAPPSRDLETIKMIVEIGAGSATFIKTLLDIREKLIRKGKSLDSTLARRGNYTGVAAVAGRRLARSQHLGLPKRRAVSERHWNTLTCRHRSGILPARSR